MKVQTILEAKYSMSGQTLSTKYTLYDLGNKHNPYVYFIRRHTEHSELPSREMIFSSKEAANDYKTYIKQGTIAVLRQMEFERDEQYISDVKREANYQLEVLERCIIVSIIVKVT